jgi:hypothetical protein
MSSERRNLFVLKHNGRDDNLGDQVILLTLAEHLREFGAVHMQGTPPDFLAGQVAGSHEARLVAEALMTRLRGGRRFDFAPPGARLWTAPTQPRAKRSRRETWLRRLTRQKWVALGLSVIPGADHSWCKGLSWIGVRDRASLAALKPVAGDRVEYFPDLALMLTPRPGTSARAGVGLSFRRSVPELRGADDGDGALPAAVAAMVASLPRDLRSAAIAFHQVEEDTAFADELAQTNGLAIHPARLTLQTWTPFYQELRMVLSNRLHCLLLGACCGALPIAVTAAGHVKLVSLFESLGWADLVVPTDDASQVAARIQAIVARAPFYGTLVADTLAAQRTIGRETLARVFGAGRSRVSR